MFNKIPSKGDLKSIRSLSMKKYRESEGMFVVEGEKMVDEALSSGMDVLAVYRTEEIGEDVMSKMTLLSSPSPALAVVRKHPGPDTEQSLTKDSLKGISLALDSVRDPGNMGTILRIADWFGIERIFASEDCVDIYNPKAVQASMGSIFRKNVDYIDLKNVIRLCRDASIPVYVTALDGENIHDKRLSRENALIIMGSENNGVSPELSSMATGRLFIPPYPSDSAGGRSESLNVATAAAIVCYEFRRKQYLYGI